MIKIGFFDSGIGGLSILREVNQLLPHVPFYYLSDAEFMPYGSKSLEEIQNRLEKMVDELIHMDCGHIVVACNTATTMAINALREKYPSLVFIGVEPYINAINKIPELKNPVVLVTESTSQTRRFKDLVNSLDPQNKIHVFPCKRLALLAENAFYQGLTPALIEEIKNELAPLKGLGHSHIILGCTHYNFLKDIISEYLSAECICPGDHVAQRVRSLTLQNKGKAQKEKGFHFKKTNQINWEYWPKSSLSKVLAYD